MPPGRAALKRITTVRPSAKVIDNSSGVAETILFAELSIDSTCKNFVSPVLVIVVSMRLPETILASTFANGVLAKIAFAGCNACTVSVAPLVVVAVRPFRYEVVV